MEAIIIEIVNKFGYLGIMLLIAIENIFPPIPSEVILTFGGFATTVSDITVSGAIISATIGSAIGAIVLYWIGRFINSNKIDKVVDSRVGKLLGMKKDNINKAFTWFNSKGKYAVFFGRFVPIVRSLVSIPAGMAKMLFIPFIILTTAGSLIWNSVLITLGRIAGTSWKKISEYISSYSDIVLGAFIVLFVLGIIALYVKKSGIIKVIKIRKSKKETEKE